MGRLPRHYHFPVLRQLGSKARSLGVEKATIDECLVHAGDLQLADVYIERDWRILWDAQEKVLAAFRWPVFASSGNGED